MTLREQAEQLQEQMARESWNDSTDRLERMLEASEVAEKDNANLRAALEIYANRANWIASEVAHGAAVDFVLVEKREQGTYRAVNGYEIAEGALKGESE